MRSVQPAVPVARAPLCLAVALTATVVAAACAAVPVGRPGAPPVPRPRPPQTRPPAPRPEPAPRPPAGPGGGVARPTFSPGLGWFDVHTHCKPDFETVAHELGVDEMRQQARRGPAGSREGLIATELPAIRRRAQGLDLAPLCSAAAWRQAARGLGRGEGGAAILSLAFTAANRSLRVSSDPMRQMAGLVGDLTNDVYATAAGGPGSLYAFPALACWYDTPYTSPGWLAACKEDVDEWIRRGAIGFKDYAGGTFLDAFNAYHGLCRSADACMTEPTARYPLLDVPYRDLVAYIVRDKRAVLVSHAVYNNFSGRPCFDARGSGRDTCAAVSLRNVTDFASWAERSLPPEARRRIVIAHLALALPSRHNQPQVLDRILAAGLSADVAAELEDLAGCSLRQTFARYPRQILFGTDLRVNREPAVLAATYQAYFHALGGPWGEARAFDTAEGRVTAVGMALDSPRVAGCAAVAPAGLLDGILRDNFVSLYQPAGPPGP